VRKIDTIASRVSRRGVSEAVEAQQRDHSLLLCLQFGDPLSQFLKVIAQDRARCRFGFIEQGADAGQRHAGLAEGLDGMQALGIGLAVAAVARRRAPAGREQADTVVVQ
jgi:hypothetical protein